MSGPTTRSPNSVRAVSIKIGMRFNSSRSVFATVHPSASGIATSSSSTSGCLCPDGAERTNSIAGGNHARPLDFIGSTWFTRIVPPVHIPLAPSASATCPGERALLCQSDHVNDRKQERTTIAMIAIGGVIGSSARWAVIEFADVTTPEQFPWHTLAINLIGCLLIGATASRLQRDTTAWAFVVTGVLGGFTTMSSFAVELNNFADDGQTGTIVAYLGLTVVGGLAALLLAERLTPPRNREETT
jgi:CrcB protein